MQELMEIISSILFIMVEIKNYAIVGLIIALMGSLGVIVTDTDVIANAYGCEVEDVPDMYCFKLSNANDEGIQRNCYYNKESSRKYKVCSTGWELITHSDLSQDKPILEDFIGIGNGWYTSSPRGDICYPIGDLKRGVPCESI